MQLTVPPKEPAAGLRDGFVRQRRSLIAVSLVLLLYTTSGIVVKELSILGNNFDVARPKILPLALWVTWAYFLIRFYQYFRDLQDPASAAALHSKLRPRVERAAAEQFKRTFELPEHWDRNKAEYQFDTIMLRAPQKDRSWLVHVKGAVVHVTPEQSEARVLETDLVVPFDANLERRATLDVMLHTRFGTEYLLPFLVAVAPVVAWLIKAGGRLVDAIKVIAA